MPTAPDRIYNVKEVVPFYARERRPDILRFTLPINKTYSAGQIMAENKAVPGQADAYVQGDANLGNWLGVMRYDCITDANGNVFKGNVANPEKISSIGAQIYIANCMFNVADLVGLTAAVLTARPGAHMVHGVVTGPGVVSMP